MTLGLITGLSSVYVVDQTQQAVVTQLGRPVKVITNPVTENQLAELKSTYESKGVVVEEGPGLRFKLPFFQTVKKYERRLLRWNGLPEEIPTKDKKYIWMDLTARWYIADPLKFLETVGTSEQAQARLDDTIDSAVRNAITSRDLLEIVRTDNRPMQVTEEELRETTNVGQIYEGRTEIVKEITMISKEACKQYGIGIHEEGVLIKGNIYVESVKKTVEDRMIAERSRIAEKYRSEGQGEYERIMGKKEREIKRISSEAYRTAKTVEGIADAEALRIYADGFSQDPEFYRFVRTLELYKNSLDGSKLIIGINNPLLNLLDGENSPNNE
ncbi:HflC protein [Candidatus Woesearchaeota archaeon CG10_big_fil_rev_8_21_14_0_10_30_7]|nr:MAG: HflC protein [Candidatus Woesearchaeota archaeon CG10_big_fil_rev_8_21_14_0_10_30_7]